MSEVKLSKIFKVEYSSCDVKNEMNLSYILKKSQEISMQHCDEMEIGTDFLSTVNKVFLLAKMKVTVFQMPKGGDILKIKTIPYLPERLQFQRINRFYNDNDKLMIDVDSRWILVDTTTGRISRDIPKKFVDCMAFNAPKHPEDFKIKKYDDMNFVESIKVRYSQIDTNNHLNNAAYADIICNCAEKNLTDKSIKDFSIVYHHEAKYSKIINLYTTHKDDMLYVKGILEDGGLCFESSLTLKQNK